MVRSATPRKKGRGISHAAIPRSACNLMPARCPVNHVPICNLGRPRIVGTVSATARRRQDPPRHGRSPRSRAGAAASLSKPFAMDRNPPADPATAHPCTTAMRFLNQPVIREPASSPALIREHQRLDHGPELIRNHSQTRCRRRLAGQVGARTQPQRGLAFGPRLAWDLLPCRMIG